MSTLVIEPVDEAFIRLHADRAILDVIYEAFSFQPDGYQHHPKYRNGWWDGFVHLLNLNTRKMYKGLMGRLADWAVENGVECTTAPGRAGELGYVPPVSEEYVKSFLRDLKLPADKQPRDFQLEGLLLGLTTRRCLLLSPTGSGKSLLIHMLAQAIHETNRRTLLLVPSVALVHQMHGDIQEYSGGLPSQPVQLIHGNKAKVVNVGDEGGLVIANWQAIVHQVPEWFQQFGAVIVDEAHEAKADSIKGIMEMATNAVYRIGLTGTLDECKTNHMVLEGLFGPAHRLAHTKELQDRGILAPVKVVSVIFKHTAVPKELKDKYRSERSSGKAYKAEIDYLIAHPTRNQWLADLAIGHSKNVLLLFERVEKHGQVLHDLIKAQAPGRNVFYIHGEVDGKIRNEHRASIESSNDSITSASLGTFQRGINIVNLHSVILAHIGKSKVRVLQSIGRGLRPADDKSVCTIIDIADDLSHGKFVNYSMRHLKKRLELYYEEQFPVESHVIPI